MWLIIITMCLLKACVLCVLGLLSLQYESGLTRSLLLSLGVLSSHRRPVLWLPALSD